MLTISVTCPNLPAVTNYYQRKTQYTDALVGNVSTKAGLAGIQTLKMTAPRWTGTLANEGILGRLVVFKLIGRYWITFPLPYTIFADQGRGESVAKNSPKKWLRWYTAPVYQDRSRATSANKVFAKKSAPVPPTNFIRNGVLNIQRLIPEIARLEIDRWLRT